jgi:single-stranded-DNA-specific exonuclease
VDARAVSFAIPPYDFAVAARLEAELGISHTLAQVLVRRGHGNLADARSFLAADVSHPLDAFGGLRAGARRIHEHLARGSRVTVHGDYDVDGVCSTAILVRALRTLGGDVDWYLPSRIDDGYGLSAATVERLARRGTGLLVTVDCGITAVAEVAQARSLGIDVVVTDHHSPRADGSLPDAPIVHPRVGGNPWPDLCAAGVAYKLAGALLELAGLDAALADEDLDLVALATIADVVPLRDENRQLVRSGLRRLASTRKPGLRALMDVAGVDPSGVDTTGVAFRMAPRINAAGRLRRADAGLELILTDDGKRAGAIAAELDDCNRERRDVETRILFQAEAQVSAAPAGSAAFVLAGDGWHPGVIGIVASRIAERHFRPAVLIALDGDQGTGSGRSIPAFDLLAALDAVSSHLLRHGGHRAAAGLTIARESVDDFRDAFVAFAAERLAPDDLVRRERIDAVVPGDCLHLELAEELERLAPFGMGNPGISLLVPSAVLEDPRPMGEGRHVAFHLKGAGTRSRAVRFGGGAKLPVPEGIMVDAAVRLEVNAFNGMVEPRVVLRHAQTPACAPIEVLGEPSSFGDGLHAELDRRLEPWPEPGNSLTGAGRARRDHRGRGIAGLLADLVASGDRVLAVCAHSPQRAGALDSRVGGFALVSWSALEDAPAIAERYDHVVAIDPPPHGHLHAALERLPGEGWVHLAWGEAELRFAQRILEWDYDLRPPLTAVYRKLRSSGAVAAHACEALLCGEGLQRRSPALAGRLVRVLSELSLVELDRSGLSLTVLPAFGRTPLEGSSAYRAYRVRLEEGRRCLTSSVATIAA